ncbi:MAG: GNAT family N-acetyltransferase [Patescibacteria group bacterium]|jgi:ribosomal protein S18 acetylase RimI-like enzyme
MTKIRPYIPIDYPDIKQNLIEGDLFYEELDNEGRINQKIQNNPNSILVTELDGKAVGNVFIMDDGWMALIFHLAVRKDYQHKGIGTELLKAAESYLKDKGYKEVQIVVREANPELLGYYEKLGYQKGGSFRWMTKELH